MSQKKLVTLLRLFSFIDENFAQDKQEIKKTDNVFNQIIKSNIEFEFSSLTYGQTKNINDFPEKLKVIFDPFIKDFKRYGANTYKQEQDISLFFSILTCVSNDFYDMPQDIQFKNILKLRDTLIAHVIKDKTFIESGYDKLAWTTKDVLNSLKSYKSNRIVLRLLADYFHINIFILNIPEDKIYAVCTDNIFHMFKKSILIVFNDDKFEPMKYQNSFFLTYESEPIIKITKVDKALVGILDANFSENPIPAVFQVITTSIGCEKFAPMSNADEQDDAEEEPNEKVDESNGESKNDPEKKPDKESEEAFERSEGASIAREGRTKEKPKTKEPNINSKMKLDEIQKMAEKYDVSLTKKGKKKTKTQLIEELQCIGK